MVCVSRFFQRLTFVLAATIFAALGLGFALGEFGMFGVHAGGEQDGAYRQMHVYAEVLKRIQSDYVTDPNINQVTTGALHGLLESLDADSSYLTPTEYKIYKDRPSTGVAQIGVTVSKRYGYATIVSVVPGSPADREHLCRRRCDRIHRRQLDPRAFAGRYPTSARRQNRQHRHDLCGSSAQSRIRTRSLSRGPSFLRPRSASSSMRIPAFSI